jgi:FtsH-binding integral membrane protein
VRALSADPNGQLSVYDTSAVKRTGTRAMLEHTLTHYPTIAGVSLVTLFFFAGYADFRESRPTGMTWFWWGWGFLGTISFSVLTVRAGHIWPVVFTCTYGVLIGYLVWTNLRTHHPKNQEP